MADRFRGKTCVLCGTRPSAGVGEHVASKWFKRDFAQEGPFKSENAGVPYTNRDGDLAIQETLHHDPQLSFADAEHVAGYPAAPRAG